MSAYGSRMCVALLFVLIALLEGLEGDELDALRLQEVVLRLGELAERGLAGVDAVGEDEGERGDDQLDDANDLRESSF